MSNPAPTNGFRKGFDPRRNMNGQIKPSKQIRQLVKEGVDAEGSQFLKKLWATGKDASGNAVPSGVQLKAFIYSYELTYGTLQQSPRLNTPAENVVDFSSMSLGEVEVMLAELQVMAKAAIEDKSSDVVADSV